jgi:hypothetical protein
MTTYLRTATTSIALAFMLIGVTARAQEFTNLSAPVWSSSGRQIQLTGKVLCTGCPLEEVRKAYPDVPGSHLYEMQYDQGQMVIELFWISNPRWGDWLTTPHVVKLRADDSLLQQLRAKENQAKELHATGLLSHSGTLHVSAVKLLASCPEETGQDFASQASIFECGEESQRER